MRVGWLYERKSVSEIESELERDQTSYEGKYVLRFCSFLYFFDVNFLWYFYIIVIVSLYYRISCIIIFLYLNAPI